MNTDLLVLRRSDIVPLLSLPDCIQAMEMAFRMYAHGQALAPGLMHTEADGGDFHIKGGGLRLERTYFALKASGCFFGNRASSGLPNIMGLVLLFDGQNGRPLAVMDSIDITVLRTGATTALAARYLARQDASTVTICGCGNQGRVQLSALNHVLPSLRRVFAWDGNQLAAQEFAQEMSARMRLDARATTDLSRAVSQSDVIITCTPSKAYYLREADVRAGTFIGAVGADSPDKQELEPSLLAKSTVVVDILEQCARVGELHHALSANLMTTADVHGQLGDVVIGQVAGRSHPDEITIFDTTGSAIQDTAAAALVYREALARGVGETINLYR